jgi:hypothetical protein
MSRAFSSLSFCLGYVATYFLSTALPTPLIWYYPLERKVAWGLHPMGVAADFYGRVGLSVVGGLVLVALARGFPVRTRENPVWTYRLVSWIVGLLFLTAGLYIFSLIHRQPIPAPLPQGYVPL